MSNFTNFLGLLGKAALQVAVERAERNTSTLAPVGSFAPVNPLPILQNQRTFFGKDWISDRRSFEGVASDVMSAAQRKCVSAAEMNLFHSNVHKFSKAMFFDEKDVTFEHYLLPDGRDLYRFTCNGELTSLTF